MFKSYLATYDYSVARYKSYDVTYNCYIVTKKITCDNMFKSYVAIYDYYIAICKSYFAT